MTSTTKRLVHGIDLTAPGGVQALLARHRGLYGDSRMEAGGQGDGEQGGQHGDDGQQGRGTAPSGDQLGDAGKKAIEAERRAARDEKKRADDLAKRLAEFEDRDKTDAQRATDRAEQAEARAAAAEGRALRAEVSAETGVPADLLSGGTEDELRSHAARLLEYRGGTTGGAGSGAGQQPGTGQAAGRPRPDATQGQGAPAAGKSQLDVQSTRAQMERALGRSAPRATG